MPGRMGGNGAARRVVRPVGVRDGAAGVTDILGSLLLVGITVVMAVGLGFLLLSFDGPADTQHTRLAVVLAPGPGGTWADGDEEIRIQHLGGERMSRGETRIVYQQAGVRTGLEGAALGSAFGDGEFIIGETWTRPLAVALNEAIVVQVLGLQGDGATLLSSTTALAGATAASLCLGDVTPPAVIAWDQEPDDVTSLTALTDPPGTVEVIATIRDDCGSVAAGMAPLLRWCLGLACAAPFPNTLPMTRVGTTDDWSAIIPAQSWATAALAGQTLWYQVHDMRDPANNVGNSPPQADVVQLIATYAYVSSLAPAPGGGLGTLDTLANANSEATPGTYSTLTEAATAGSPGSATATLAGTTATGAGVSNPGSVTSLSDDNTRATGIGSGEWVELSVFDVPAGATGVSNIVIHSDVRKSANGGQTVTYRMDYKVGSGGSWVNEPGVHTAGGNSDTLASRNIQASVTTVANAENLFVRVAVASITGSGGSRTLEVDRLWVVVTYGTPAGTVHKMDMRGVVTGVGAGATRTLELVHQRTVDTYDVLVYNHVAATWRDCGDLTGAPASFSCLLNPLQNEVSATGEVHVRFVDKDPANTAAGTLALDYLRVAIL